MMLEDPVLKAAVCFDGGLSLGLVERHEYFPVEKFPLARVYLLLTKTRSDSSAFFSP